MAARATCMIAFCNTMGNLSFLDAVLCFEFHVKTSATRSSSKTAKRQSEGYSFPLYGMVDKLKVEGKNAKKGKFVSAECAGLRLRAVSELLYVDRAVL